MRSERTDQQRVSTFIANVEAHVVVWLVGDELDPHRRPLADHALKRNLPTPPRVEQNHRAPVQAAPQHQPADKRRDRVLFLKRNPTATESCDPLTCPWAPEPVAPGAGAAAGPYAPPGTRSRTGPGWHWVRGVGRGTEPSPRWHSSLCPHKELQTGSHIIFISSGIFCLLAK